MEIRFFDKVYNEHPMSTWDVLANACEDYFYIDRLAELLGYKRCRVISSDILAKDNTKGQINFVLTALKVLSYVTCIFPLVVLALKFTYRYQHKFSLCLVFTKPVSPHPFEKETPFFAEMKQKVRQLRENKNFVLPPSQTPPNFSIMVGKTPVNALIQALSSEDQEKLEKKSGCFERQVDEKTRDDVVKKGKDLFAHGVEGAKGGMVCLLNIMLEGAIKGFRGPPYIGRLSLGETCDDPTFFSGPHGPYYVIVDNDALKALEDFPSPQQLNAEIIDQSFHVAYLVPKEEHRLFIISALKRAVEVGMLTLQEADAMCSKIITYPEFLRLPPQAIVNAKSLQHAVLDAPFSNKEIH